MHESVLRDFFLGKADAGELSMDIKESIALMTPPGADYMKTSVGIVRMDSDFDLSRAHLLKVCDEFLVGGLSAIDVEYIAFALIVSDQFIWAADDDATLAEILHDWAAPQINYSLNVENMARCRRLLDGTEKYPARTEAAP